MFRKIALVVAGVIAGFGIATATTASAATITPTPGGTVRAHHAPAGYAYACVSVDAAGAHMLGFRKIDGPYAYDLQAVSDCHARQLSTPKVDGVPVRWIVKLVSQ